MKGWNTEYRGYIYFFEVNTKYISSNVLKISEISRVRSTSEIADIFNTWDEIFFGIYRKKVNFLFIFSVEGKKLHFFHSYFSLILPGSAGLVGIILCENTVCT